MRQLVTIVRDGQLLLFTQDGDDVQQVAQLVDPGLDVRDVVGLGVTLGALYEPKRRPAPARSLPPAPEAKSTTKSAQGVRRGYTPTGITDAQTLAAVAAHPGSTPQQLAVILLGVAATQGAKDAIVTRLWKLAKNGSVRSERVPGINAAGAKALRTIYHPIEPQQRLDITQEGTPS